MLSEAERRVMILDFVRKNSSDNDPKITKSDVMKHLKHSRMMTTHKTTVQLIKEGKIKIIRPKDRLYSDCLVINEENEFNKIYIFLMQIDSLIDKMQNANRKSKTTLRKIKTEKDTIAELVKFTSNFVQGYYDANDEMLIRLLVKTKNKIHSEIDSNLLYSKTIDIIYKLHHYFPPELDVLDHIVNVKLKDAKSSPVFRASDIDIKLIDDIIEVIQNFKNLFPIESK